jgi:hypothetical protein
MIGEGPELNFPEALAERKIGTVAMQQQPLVA